MHTNAEVTLVDADAHEVVIGRVAGGGADVTPRERVHGADT